MNLHVNGNHTMLGLPVQLVPLDRSVIDDVWPLVERWLAEGMLACGEDLNIEYTIAAAKAGDLQLWAVKQGHFVIAAMTSRFWPSQTGMVCHLTVGGGMHMEDWLHLCKQVEEYAKANDCVKVRLAGRNGWERKLTNYRRVGVILERELP